MTGPRIVLIHATPVAIDPVARAFAEDWPEARPVNLLDDSLSVDRAAEAELSPALTRRLVGLARYGEDIGAAGILFTCSAFGPAIEAAAESVAVPVLKPNQAMFEAARTIGGHLGLLATFAPSVAPMAAEFAALAAGSRLDTHVVPESMAALRTGDAATHDRLLAEAAPALAHCDAIMLAHFSTARALASVRSAVSCPVLTSPNSAVASLRTRIEA